MSFAKQGPAFALRIRLKTTGNPPTTQMDVPPTERATFQIRPCTVYRSNPRDGVDFQGLCGSRPICDPTLNQTPHASGMLAAFADGSVRILNPDIRHEIFWGAVTPAGGEILGDW